ncbi:alpha/beta hydrolase [Phenylobacterium sp.]|uniref:alpha/beta hydrolase n=1 Tax=Phenylobacterium sp. TaxID=1871053 RepID=UPI002E31013A|nr:alpha/beta fold hydrolase [Phenylobacterium sp.]HEX2560790.1 alpha/beta fold hydrolase [Phenylobacterium sp.]
MRPLAFRAVPEAPPPDGAYLLALETAAGAIRGRVHPAAGDASVLWVFGSGGGLGGPAGGLYARLGGQLQPRGVASLEIDYRRPGSLTPCVEDVLTGIEHLKALGKRRIVLVGHSFGGAVVITAGVLSDDVVGVAALSSQRSGTSAVAELAPRPLLVAHGEADEVLPAQCSQDIYARAQEPKRLVLYPGCRHGLDQCREALGRDVSDWLAQTLAL